MSTTSLLKTITIQNSVITFHTRGFTEKKAARILYLAFKQSTEPLNLRFWYFYKLFSHEVENGGRS